MCPFCFDISLRMTLPKEKGWEHIPLQLECNIFYEAIPTEHLLLWTVEN